MTIRLHGWLDGMPAGWMAVFLLPACLSSCIYVSMQLCLVKTGIKFNFSLDSFMLPFFNIIDFFLKIKRLKIN